MELRTDEDEDEGDGDGGYNDHWDDHEGDDGTGKPSSRNWVCSCNGKQQSKLLMSTNSEHDNIA